jgi:hypothetical protein
MKDPESLDFPTNWDLLREATGDDAPATPPETRSHTPSLLTLCAAAWAELVVLLAVCTLALLSVALLGYHISLPAFPWAAGLALLWWVGAGATLVIVRQATPGMLLAGILFDGPVQPRRIPFVLAVALIMALLLGLPIVMGLGRSLLTLLAQRKLAMSSEHELGD